MMMYDGVSRPLSRSAETREDCVQWLSGVNVQV